MQAFRILSETSIFQFTNLNVQILTSNSLSTSATYGLQIAFGSDLASTQFHVSRGSWKMSSGFAGFFVTSSKIENSIIAVNDMDLLGLEAAVNAMVVSATAANIRNLTLDVSNCTATVVAVSSAGVHWTNSNISDSTCRIDGGTWNLGGTSVAMLNILLSNVSGTSVTLSNMVLNQTSIATSVAVFVVQSAFSGTNFRVTDVDAFLTAASRSHLFQIQSGNLDSSNLIISSTNRSIVLTATSGSAAVWATAVNMSISSSTIFISGSFIITGQVSAMLQSSDTSVAYSKFIVSNSNVRMMGQISSHGVVFASSSTLVRTSATVSRGNWQLTGNASYMLRFDTATILSSNVSAFGTMSVDIQGQIAGFLYATRTSSSSVNIKFDRVIAQMNAASAMACYGLAWSNSSDVSQSNVLITSGSWSCTSANGSANLLSHSISSPVVNSTMVLSMLTVSIRGARTRMWSFDRDSTLAQSNVSIVAVSATSTGSNGTCIGLFWGSGSTISSSTVGIDNSDWRFDGIGFTAAVHAIDRSTIDRTTINVTTSIMSMTSRTSSAVFFWAQENSVLSASTLRLSASTLSITGRESTFGVHFRSASHVNGSTILLENTTALVNSTSGSAAFISFAGVTLQDSMIDVEGATVAVTSTFVMHFVDLDGTGPLATKNALINVAVFAVNVTTSFTNVCNLDLPRGLLRVAPQHQFARHERREHPYQHHHVHGRRKCSRHFIPRLVPDRYSCEEQRHRCAGVATRDPRRECLIGD